MKYLEFLLSKQPLKKLYLLQRARVQVDMAPATAADCVILVPPGGKGAAGIVVAALELFPVCFGMMAPFTPPDSNHGAPADQFRKEEIQPLDDFLTLGLGHGCTSRALIGFTTQIITVSFC